MNRSDLELEIDTRMADIWAIANMEILGPLQVGALLRAAYGKGYTDALQEKDKGRLYTMFGLPIPRQDD